MNFFHNSWYFTHSCNKVAVKGASFLKSRQRVSQAVVRMSSKVVLRTRDRLKLFDLMGLFSANSV